ncbi:MAG: translocation/assembly module TamB domain-containing protein, partial [Bacteroidota bacterium]
SLPEEKITFKEGNQVVFQNFTILDRAKNAGVLNGNVQFEELTNPTFSLRFQAKKFELLDTQKSDELYYGKVMINTTAEVSGDTRKTTAKAQVKVLDGSSMTIIVPEYEYESLDHEGIVRFVPPPEEEVVDTDTTGNVENVGLTGIDLVADLEISPKADLKILIDQTSGDFLEMNGKAQLSYALNPNGQTSLSGSYEVQSGKYEFTFYNLIKKEFVIDKGSRITWDGDPYNARLNATATYQVKTSAMPIIEGQLSSAGAASGQYSEPLPFEVKLFIRGTVSNPDLSFSIKLQEERQNAFGGVVDSKLLQLNGQESELNKQVFSMLLFNRFLSENALSGGSSGSLTGTARNSVSKFLTQQFNGLAGKYIKGVQVNLGISSGAARSDSDLKLELSKGLFDDKLIITLGSSVGLSGEQVQEGRNLAQDVQLDYKLDPDG